MAREVHYYDPTHLIIVGLDIEEDGSPLNDECTNWDVDEPMVKNIMVYGIQQPVLVRREAGKIYVVDGRQRVKAARAAASRQDGAGEFSTKVPCIEVQGDDGRVSGIMISTNEIRNDDAVLAKAAKAARLMDMVGDKEEVALAFGRSTKTLDNWAKLLAADPKVHEAIREGKISAAVGISLSGKSRQDQIVALDQILTESPATTNTPKKKGDEKKKKTSSADPDRQHPGIKKGWLRKAQKTVAYENLDPDRQAVITWILSGHVGKDHWLDKFTWAVDEELDTHE